MSRAGSAALGREGQRGIEANPPQTASGFNTITTKTAARVSVNADKMVLKFI